MLIYTYIITCLHIVYIQKNVLITIAIYNMYRQKLMLVWMVSTEITTRIYTL